MGYEENDQLKRKAFSGTIWKFAERICAQGVSLVVSILLARMLMPEDYSVVSIAAIFFAFCNVFISGGMSSALIQKKNATIEDYSTMLYLNLAMAGFLYALMFFCAPAIAALFKKEQVISIIRVMGLTFFINAIKSIVSAYTYSNLDFRQFFMSTIVGTALSAIVGISMAKQGMGVWALVAQEMTNSAIDTLILCFSTRIRFVKVFSFARVKSLFGFGWKIMLSSMITVVYDQVSPLIVGLKFTPADLAYYNKGKSFPGLLNSSISETLTSVLFPVMVKVQDSKEDILNITRRYVKIASYVIFPFMVGLFAISENFIRVLLTEKWISAAIYVQIFAVFYMFDLIQVGSLQAIRAIGRSDIILLLEVIKKIVYLVIIVLFLLLSSDPKTFAYSALLCMALSVLIDVYPSRKIFGYRYRYLLADIAPNLFISAVMGSVVILLGQLEAPALLLLLVQITVGVCSYVLLSVLLKNENFRYLWNFGMEIIKKKD